MIFFAEISVIPMGTYIRFIRAAIASRSPINPKDGPYCIAPAPSSCLTLTATSSSSFRGNVIGAGSPPAKEIISGWAVNASNGPRSEPFILPSTSEKRIAIVHLSFTSRIIHRNAFLIKYLQTKFMKIHYEYMYCKSLIL